MDAATLEALAQRASAAAPQAAIRRPVVPGLVLHVDGDMICYSCAGNDETLPGEARQRAVGKINKLRAMSGADTVLVHMTSAASTKGERYLVATVKPYQGQRSDGRKPKNHAYLCEWLSGYSGPDMTVKVWSKREADDGIAACAYHAQRCGKAPGYIAIATQDKDMRMLPGLHVDWISYELVTVQHGAFSVTNNGGKVFGSKWFWLQMLMGDAADNIPGLPFYIDEKGKAKLVGEKTAEKLLAACTDNHQAFTEVYGLYQEYYTSIYPYSGDPAKSRAERQAAFCEADDRFCEQAALLWMRTGNKSEVDDFVAHTGPGNISDSFPIEVKLAAQRLKRRVQERRREVDALSG